MVANQATTRMGMRPSAQLIYSPVKTLSCDTKLGFMRWMRLYSLCCECSVAVGVHQVLMFEQWERTWRAFSDARCVKSCNGLLRFLAAGIKWCATMRQEQKK